MQVLHEMEAKIAEAALVEWFLQLFQLQKIK